MSEQRINCSICDAELIIQDEWLGMELECPICTNKFIARPKKKSLSNKKKKNDDSESSSKNILKLSFKIFFLLLLIGAGVFAYIKITKMTPEKLEGNQLEIVTQKRVLGSSTLGEIAEKDLFPVVQQKKKFFYRDAQFVSIYFNEQVKADVFKGEVTFMRKNKKMKRPVVVDRTSNLSYYSFPFSYAENPEYLEEDGDLIFALAKKIDKSLAEWDYVSGKADGKNKLICTIKHGSKEKKLTLLVHVVKCKDQVDRIWVEFPKK